MNRTFCCPADTSLCVSTQQQQNRAKYNTARSYVAFCAVALSVNTTLNCDFCELRGAARPAGRVDVSFLIHCNPLTHLTHFCKQLCVIISFPDQKSCKQNAVCCVLSWTQYDVPRKLCGGSRVRTYCDSARVRTYCDSAVSFILLLFLGVQLPLSPRCDFMISSTVFCRFVLFFTVVPCILVLSQLYRAS